MVADSPVHTRLVEYLLASFDKREISGNRKRELLGVALTGCSF